VLVAAGAVNHEELVAQAEAAFGTVPDEDASTSVQSLLARVRRWPGRGALLLWALPPPLELLPALLAAAPGSAAVAGGGRRLELPGGSSAPLQLLGLPPWMPPQHRQHR
jgi:hypothetical protein